MRRRSAISRVAQTGLCRLTTTSPSSRRMRPPGSNQRQARMINRQVVLVSGGRDCESKLRHSRSTRRLLALRPAHSRLHLYVTSYTEGFSHFVTSMLRLLPAGAVAGWGLHPLESAAFARRTRITDVADRPWTPQLGG